METKHTDWGPSSAQRRILCPGSLLAERQHKDTDNIHAVIGSGAHELADRIFKQSDHGDFIINPTDWINEIIFVEMSEDLDEPVEFDTEQVVDVYGGYEVSVDMEMVDNISMFVEYVQALATSKDCHFFGSEIKLDLSNYLDNQKGTSDIILLIGRTLYVIDLKYGKGIKVYAKENAQTRMYGLGAIEELEYLYDIDEVVMVIHQPRLNHVDKETLTVDELKAWADDTLRPAYGLSIQKSAPRIPGEKQCQFCKHKAKCVELATEVEEQIRTGFPVLEDKTKLDDEVIPLQIASLAETWAKAVKAYAIERLEAGEHVYDGEQHYKLVHGRGSRNWINETRAKQQCKASGLSKDKFMTDPVFKSVAQVEKELGQKKFKADFMDLEDGKKSSFVNKQEGKPTLAPESDNRPPINSAEALGFETVEEEDYLN